MKIAVVCALGRAAKAITREAADRGIQVKAVQRREGDNGAGQTLIKDLFDLTYADLEDCEAVVDAFGAWAPETLPLHDKSLAYLCDLLSGRDKRLIVVGGAGSLYMDGKHTTALSDTEGFPDDYKPLASAMAQGLKNLRKRSDVKWTYISPAADFRADGERTGQYLFGGEEFITNEKGESVISYADYAAAVVDEIMSGNNIGKRISVIGK